MAILTKDSKLGFGQHRDSTYAELVGKMEHVGAHDGFESYDHFATNNTGINYLRWIIKEFKASDPRRAAAIEALEAHELATEIHIQKPTFEEESEAKEEWAREDATADDENAQWAAKRSAIIAKHAAIMGKSDTAALSAAASRTEGQFALTGEIVGVQFSSEERKSQFVAMMRELKAC